MVIVPQIEAANIGMADSLVLMVLALVVFGPRKLPQIGRQIGKLMYEFRKASNDFKYQMEEELRNAEEADRRKKEEERLAAMTPVPGAVKEEKAEPEVTHVLEAGDSAPSGYEEAAKESNPYPYGGDVPPSETEAVEELESVASESTETMPVTSQTTSEAATPKIQPPATGAPIAYKPGMNAAAEPEAADAEAEIPTPGAGTEQTAHHD